MPGKYPWGLICVGAILFSDDGGAQVSNHVVIEAATRGSNTQNEILVTATPITAYETVEKAGGSQGPFLRRINQWRPSR